MHWPVIKFGTEKVIGKDGKSGYLSSLGNPNDGKISNEDWLKSLQNADAEAANFVNQIKNSVNDESCFTAGSAVPTDLNFDFYCGNTKIKCSDAVKAGIKYVAETYGVDISDLATIAYLESSLNERCPNPYGHVGLYQFDAPAWKTAISGNPSIASKEGLSAATYSTDVWDPKKSAVAYYLNSKYIAPKYLTKKGAPVTAVTAYMVHNMGPRRWAYYL